ncbi:MAG: hypothetical protein Q7K43_06515 [Candidatus Woesearchaeota archaeon]|nr:hypothetical protein [Candidatus Woesearchaeota archaeon]
MGFLDRLSNAWKIFIFSFSLLKKDKSLAVVPLFMLLGAGLIFVPLLLLAFGGFVGSARLVFVGVIFLFLFYFVETFFAAAQSWMVYEVIRGKDTTIGSGFKRAFHNSLDILAFTGVSIVVFFLSRFLRRKGITGAIGASVLTSLSGILGKLVIPSMIVTERHFGQAVAQLRQSLRAAPEVATYEIGIRPLNVLLMVMGVVLTLLFALSFGGLFAGLFIMFYITALVLVNVYVNSAYYTVAYLALIEKRKIPALKLAY